MRPSTTRLALAGLLTGLTAVSSFADRPIKPRASPRPVASAAPASEEIPEAYRRTLAALRNRRPEFPEPVVTLRFGSLDAVPWPVLRVQEVRSTVRGLAVLFEGDPRERREGETIEQVRIVSVKADEVVLEFNGETRTVPLRRSFPAIVVRTVRQVEGEWAVFIEGERRAFYVGDVYKDAKIVRVEVDGATFQYGQEARKVSPKPSLQPFPQVTFIGIIDMPGRRVVLMRDRSEPLAVGDTVEGAKIVAIMPTHVALEFGGETRWIPIR